VASHPGADDRRLRILVVDDEAPDRLAIRRYLLQAGVPAVVDEVTSAREALQRVGAEAPDCVLLDYYLPGDDALALLRSLRDTATDVPVVILTGRGGEEVAVELMKAGAADYVPKAVLTPERLAATLRHAMELARTAAARRHAEAELRAQEARFRTLANSIPQFAWMADPTGAVYWYNQRWYDYTGTTLEKVQGWHWQDVHHPDHVRRVVERIRRSIDTGEPWEDTFPLRATDGTYRWFLSRALPVRGDGGEVVGWLGTHTDITDQKAAEAERERLLAREREARTGAERAIRMRDEVLGIVAHDLRNPMNAIAVSAATMTGVPVSEDQRLRQLEIIRRSAKELDRLISDLLDVSRIESGTFVIRAAPVHVRALLDEAQQLFEPLARARQIALDVGTAADLPPVAGDRDRLVQVLSNLLDNALKFTRAHGRVVLRARRLDGAVQISVEDSGPGIPAEHLPHVFDRFWQADRASRAGAGLGLAICKGLVEAHGGRIEAESTFGHGAVFRFTVPCAAA